MFAFKGHAWPTGLLGRALRRTHLSRFLERELQDPGTPVLPALLSLTREFGTEHDASQLALKVWETRVKEGVSVSGHYAVLAAAPAHSTLRERAEFTWDQRFKGVKESTSRDYHELFDLVAAQKGASTSAFDKLLQTWMRAADLGSAANGSFRTGLNHACMARAARYPLVQKRATSAWRDVLHGMDSNHRAASLIEALKKRGRSEIFERTVLGETVGYLSSPDHDVGFRQQVASCALRHAPLFTEARACAAQHRFFHGDLGSQPRVFAPA